MTWNKVALGHVFIILLINYKNLDLTMVSYKIEKPTKIQSTKTIGSIEYYVSATN